MTNNNYIVVYNGGAYGNFVGWTINWLTGHYQLNDRPWSCTGAAHNNDLIYYDTVNNACESKKTGIVHPIIDTETLESVFDLLHKSFDKIIFLYPDDSSIQWNINNKFQKIYKNGWFNEHADTVLANMQYWDNNHKPWQVREWLSFYIFKQHLSEIRYNEISSINSNKLLKVSLAELRDSTYDLFNSICNFLDLDVCRSETEIKSLLSEWKDMQLHIDKDNLIKSYIHAIVNQIDIKFENLTIVDEAEIQRVLRDDYKLHLKCYNLDVWPNSTLELHKLLYKE